MNKKELLTSIAEKSQLTFAQAEAALTATFDTIAQAMVSQDSVTIAGFGNFTTKVREERNGRNPATGQAMVIPKATMPLFQPATQLKASVNTNNQKDQ